MDFKNKMLVLSLVVAFLGLIRPELETLWRRKFHPPRLEIYPSGSVEIGYSSFRPTISLRGTLAAVHRDQFVRSIDLTLVRCEGRAHHDLTWRLFRSGRIIFGPGPQDPAELPSGFMVLTSQPYRYFILFNDNSVESAMQPHWQDVGEAWNQIRREPTEQPMINGQRMYAIGGGDLPMSGGPGERHWEERYNEFSRGELHRRAAQTLDRLCYLDPGRYRLTLWVSTDQPDRSYCRSWIFSLTDDESRRLRENGSSVLREVCGFSAYYDYAYIDCQADQTLDA